jgi:hypothetical protein
MRRFLVGFGFGLFFGVLVPGGLAVRSYLEKSRQVDEFWEGSPVLALAQDLDEGAILEESALVEQKVAEQFLTESFVPAEDRALVVGKRVHHPMQKGDVLTWSVFADQQAWNSVGECAAAAMPAIKEAERAALDAVTAEIAAGLGAGEPEASSGEAIPEPSSDVVRVVALKDDVSEGGAITADALAVLRMPAALATASVVRAEHLRKIPGVIANVPMMAGDPLLWPHLDDPERIGTTAGCYLKVGNRQTEHREKVAAEQAERFFAEREERP